MRVFENNYKINFVDNNNVVLGYDYEYICCENFYYYITDEEPSVIDDNNGIDININDDNLVFDTKYNKELYNDDTVATVFKVIGGDKDLYIVLANSHNGYYYHGFDLKDSNGKSIKSGSL